MLDSKGVRVVLALLKYLFLALIVIISLGPILWMLLSSFKTNAEILGGVGFFTGSLSIKNYITAVTMSPIAFFYRNSILVSLGTILLTLVVVGMSAYAVTRFEFRYKKLIIGVISLSLLIPGAALMQPLYTTINSLGMTNSLLGLILVYAGFALPTSFYILSSYFLTVPKEMEESAYLDGASFVATFTKIIVPISKPGFATASIITFLNAWNEFQFALILTTGTKARTLPMTLFYFNSQFSSDYGAMFAGTILVIVPSIAIYLLLQEQVVAGLSAGAIKG